MRHPCQSHAAAARIMGGARTHPRLQFMPRMEMMVGCTRSSAGPPCSLHGHVLSESLIRARAAPRVVGGTGLVAARGRSVVLEVALWCAPLARASM